VTEAFQLEVPKDCGAEDSLVIRNLRNGDVLTARMTETTPHVSAALLIRIGVFVEGMLGNAIENLAMLATKALGKAGYP
jgi:hypothetical protein